jgi:hypothetical protein
MRRRGPQRAANTTWRGSSFQANPSQSKQIQIGPSEIAWIYLVLFVRIETFQWVTANPNKNPPLRFQLASRLWSCGSSAHCSHPLAKARAAHRLYSVRGNIYNIYFCFCQDNSTCRSPPTPGPPAVTELSTRAMALTGFAGLGWLGACGSGDERPPEADDDQVRDTLT